MVGKLNSGRVDFVLPDGRKFRAEGKSPGPVAEITIIGKNFITPDEQIGSLLVRLAEFDEEGVVRWKKDIAPFKFGPEILDVDEPALEPNILTDILTIEPPKRSPCTGAAGARNCEPGVVNVFVSQNEGTEWTWENTTFAFIREPDDRAECFGGIAKEDMSQIPADIANDDRFFRTNDELLHQRFRISLNLDDFFCKILTNMFRYLET